MITLHDDEGMTEILNGVAVTRKITFERKLGHGCTVKVDVIYDPVLERLAASSISVNAEHGAEVAGAILRKIRVQDFVQEAVDHVIFVKNAKDEWQEVIGMDGYLYDLAQLDGDREETVALIYSLAKLTNMPPLKAVAETLSVSHSTATRMVTRARNNGKFHLG